MQVGGLPALFQDVLRAYFCAIGTRTFTTFIHCSLQLLAALFTLDRAVAGQVFGVVTWSKWPGRAQNNSWGSRGLSGMLLALRISSNFLFYADAKAFEGPRCCHFINL